MHKTRNNSKPSAPHSKRGHEGLTWFMLFLLVLIIPNLVLAVTEQLTAGGRVAGIVMPLAVYGLIMSLSRKTGRTIPCSSSAPSRWCSPISTDGAR